MSTTTTTEQVYCCDGFKLTIEQGGIRKFFGKWISDVVLYRDDKSTFSPVYNIEGITILLYKYCPFCGTEIKASFTDNNNKK